VIVKRRETFVLKKVLHEYQKIPECKLHGVRGIGIEKLSFCEKVLK